MVGLGSRPRAACPGETLSPASDHRIGPRRGDALAGPGDVLLGYGSALHQVSTGVGSQTGHELTVRLSRRHALMGFVGPHAGVARNGVDLSQLIPANTPAGRVHVADADGDWLFPFEAYEHCE